MSIFMKLRVRQKSYKKSVYYIIKDMADNNNNIIMDG